MHLSKADPFIVVSEIFVTHRGKLLLFRRDPESRRFPNALMLPGGHVDAGEDVLSSVIRETKEETGIKLSKKTIRLRAVAVHHHLDRNESFLIFVFVAKISKAQAVSGPNSEGAAEWVTLTALKENTALFPIVKDYLPHILNGRRKVLFTNVDCRDGRIDKIHSWMES